MKRSVPYKEASYRELSELAKSLLDEQAVARELVRGMPHAETCVVPNYVCRVEEAYLPCGMRSEVCRLHAPVCTCIRGKILAVLGEG